MNAEGVIYRESFHMILG